MLVQYWAINHKIKWLKAHIINYYGPIIKSRTFVRLSLLAFSTPLYTWIYLKHFLFNRFTNLQLKANNGELRRFIAGHRGVEAASKHREATARRFSHFLWDSQPGEGNASLHSTLILGFVCLAVSQRLLSVVYVEKCAYGVWTRVCMIRGFLILRLLEICVNWYVCGVIRNSWIDACNLKICEFVWLLLKIYLIF